MKIIFFGSSKFVIPILEVLRKNFNLSLVLTTENPKIQKSNLALQGEALQPSVINYCFHHKIPYLSVQQFNNLTIQQLQKTNAPIGILADFGLIIPQETLNAFPKGIINIHPSLLPKYRGPTPVQAAILNGKKVTGVSIMKLDEQIDHGSILRQEKEKILDTDTAESLYKRLFEKGANLLSKTLTAYLNGNLKPQTQNHKEATFTKPLTRQDGYVDLKSLEIRNLKLEIARKIRAYFPWPGVWLKMELNGKYRIIKLLPNNLIAQYPNDPFLIQVEGKKPISYKDFLNGYPDAAKNLEFIL